MSSEQPETAEPSEPGGGPPRAPGKFPGQERGIGDSYTGRSAQLAVAAEPLRRRINVAVPEVDTGIDLIAFREERPGVVRLQVRACTVPQEYSGDTGAIWKSRSNSETA